jgi:hypothetical protein
MAVPGEQESFKSQSFSGGSKTPKKTTFSSPAAMAQAQRGAEAQSMKALQDRREKTRQEFFKGREDISDDRLDRRQLQDDLYEKFKKETYQTYVGDDGKTYTKDLSLRFDTDPMSPTFGQYTRTTIADKATELAMKYGPTFKEIASDMGYAIGSMTKGAGDLIMGGNIGLLGIVKGIYNKAVGDANKGYDKLNSVQQEIFDNPDKYPYASKVPQVESVNNSRLLALEAQRDVNSFAADATGILGIDQNRLDGFVNEPIDTFGTAGPTVDMRRPTEEELDPMDIGYVESGQFKEDLQKSGILSVDDPSTGDPFSDSTKIPGQNATLGDLRKALENQGLDDLQIQSAINQVGQQIISGEYTGDFEVDTGSTTDDQVSFTPYNNPFNLEFRGQEGAEPGYGGQEGTRFASFDTLDTGITAGIDRVAEIVGEGKSTDDFLNIYAPRSDNPESYDNYLATLQDKVGETIEPNEIKSLTEGIVKFENKPELADQYLNYLEQQKDKLYSGIVS